MPPAKRKLAAAEAAEAPEFPQPIKKSRGRPKKSADASVPSVVPTATEEDGEVDGPRRSKRPKNSASQIKPPVAKSTRGRKPKYTKTTAESSGETDSAEPRRDSTVSVEIKKGNKEKPKAGRPKKPTKKAAKDQVPNEADEAKEDEERPCYWLMKAEPESRMEKGHDVKFSIDDLKNASEPEAWDGVRNYVARNNMREMKQGELAFFYHSNCKVPGIAGIMEIVQEASVDTSAHDPEHPYYDPKDKPDDPKWSIVHVEFRQKFPKVISLKTLQSFAKPGGVLEHLQTLKTTRLSVSKVTKTQWDFVLSLVNLEEAEPEVDAAGPSKANTKKSAAKKGAAKKLPNEAVGEEHED